MSKKKTDQTGASTALVVAASVPATPGVAQRFVAQHVESPDIFAGFEDKSLPPIIKPGELQPGNVVIGKITGLTVYKSEKPPIDTCILNLDILDVKDGQLQSIGFRAGMPCTTVIARALGASADKTTTGADQVKQITDGGYIGATIAMRYNGTGKERGDGRNKPHLWDIKVKKADGSVQHNIGKK